MPQRIDQMRLLKRMSWATLQREAARRRGEGSTDAEVEMCAAKARRCLEYVACLNWYLCGLEEDMVSAGTFRHSLKRAVRSAQRVAGHVHQEAWLMLNGYKQGVGRIYDARLQKVQEAIDGAVLVDDKSRNYSIICALLRIIDRLSQELHRYGWDFYYTRELESVSSLLQQLLLHDYELDSIIEIATRDV